MLERTIQNIDKRFRSEVPQNERYVYSAEFLTDIYFNDPPYSGSVDIESVLKLKNMSRYPNPIRDVTIDREGCVSFSSLSGVKDPLTQSNLIESEENEVQKIIYQVKISSILYREKIANRLLTLFKDSKEDDPSGHGITANSLHSFITFFQLHTNLKYPYISLTPECNIYASWRDVQNRVFSVHFLPNEDNHFIIFKQNHRHPERKIRTSGITTTDILMETVRLNGVSDWILE